MVARLSDPRIGVVGARLVSPDGSIQHCGVVMTEPGPWHTGRGLVSSTVSRADRPVQAVTAAAMLVRGTAFEQLGGFGSAYPFGSEDIDLCLRARQIGWGVECEQSVDSLHFESLTPGRIERDAESREVFDRTWRGRHTIDEGDIVT
jgi:GT2 family glycosyltransferase